jgi:ribosomal protein S4
MRKYLPHNDYRLLKNRKSARLCRIKRKVERATLMSKTVDYEQLCEDLRKELEEEKQRVKAIEDGSLQMREEL